LTPSCPLQAPLFEAAEVQVPSLHMPVVPAGAAAGAFASAIVLHKSIEASTVTLVFLSMENPPKDDETD
jgi:hypothetical protein